MSAAARPAPAGPRAVLAGASAFFGRHQSLSILVGGALVAIILPLVSTLPPFSAFGTQNDWVGGFADAGVFVLLAIGLNVVVGFAGLLDLGYAAFYAIGAYTFAYGASTFTGLQTPFWAMLFVGAAVAAIFGVLLGAPTLRLRGDYLAIVTLGFGEIVPVVALNSDTYTRGTNGIVGLAQPSAYGLFGMSNFGVTNPWPWFLTVVGIVAVAFMLLYRLQDSRLGRAWVAIREDELAAASMGINTVSTKLLAFAIGASTSGLAGVFHASRLGVVDPTQFRFDVSFTVLAMVVLGGMGNIWGVATGAFIIYEIQHQGLKQLGSFVQSLHVPAVQLPLVGTFDLGSINFLKFQFLLYGLALVAMMLLRPEGLFPSRQRKIELHEVEEEEEVAAEELAEIVGEGRRHGDERMTASAAAPPVLVATGVSKHFGGLVAVNAVDFDVPHGAIVSLIGPNGAGKTTFFNVVAGLYEPTQGSVHFDGREMIARSRRGWAEPMTWVTPSLVILVIGMLGVLLTSSVAVVAVALLAGPVPPGRDVPHGHRPAAGLPAAARSPGDLPQRPAQ